MKAFACLALAASTGVGAFPWLLEAKSPSPSVNEGPFAASKARRQASSSTAPTFSASDQLISTSGLYEFVAPGPLDARGPCPGLNAMANHGYLPHIGVATLPQFALACEQVFRMGSVSSHACFSTLKVIFSNSLTCWKCLNDTITDLYCPSSRISLLSWLLMDLRSMDLLLAGQLVAHRISELEGATGITRLTAPP